MTVCDDKKAYKCLSLRFIDTMLSEMVKSLDYMKIRPIPFNVKYKNTLVLSISANFVNLN